MRRLGILPFPSDFYWLPNRLTQPARTASLGSTDGPLNHEGAPHDHLGALACPPWFELRSHEGAQVSNRD